MIESKIQKWSEIKLQILAEYAAAYSTILSKQPYIKHIYIDAFAGSGIHYSERTGSYVPGSPLNALSVKPSFKKYYFVEKNKQRVKQLEELTATYQNVHIYSGDCNCILISDIFPKVKWDDYKRGLCFLDPYGMHLDWSVIQMAGEMRSIEIFLNFPILDMRRNVLIRNINKVQKRELDRMNAFWGNDTWINVIKSKSIQTNLFSVKGDHFVEYGDITKAFQTRLKEVAGFDYVPDPIPMRNNKRNILYYIFFATQNETGYRIVNDILRKYIKIGLK